MNCQSDDDADEQSKRDDVNEYSSEEHPDSPGFEVERPDYGNKAEREGALSEGAGTARGGVHLFEGVEGLHEG